MKAHLTSTDQVAYEYWLELYSKIKTSRRNQSYFLFVPLKGKSSIFKDCNLLNATQKDEQCHLIKDAGKPLLY